MYTMLCRNGRHRGGVTKQERLEFRCRRRCPVIRTGPVNRSPSTWRWLRGYNLLVCITIVGLTWRHLLTSGMLWCHSCLWSSFFIFWVGLQFIRSTTLKYYHFSYGFFVATSQIILQFLNIKQIKYRSSTNW